MESRRNRFTGKAAYPDCTGTSEKISVKSRQRRTVRKSARDPKPYLNLAQAGAIGRRVGHQNPVGTIPDTGCCRSVGNKLSLIIKFEHVPLRSLGDDWT